MDKKKITHFLEPLDIGVNAFLLLFTLVSGLAFGTQSKYFVWILFVNILLIDIYFCIKLYLYLLKYDIKAIKYFIIIPFILFLIISNILCYYAINVSLFDHAKNLIINIYNWDGWQLYIKINLFQIFILLIVAIIIIGYKLLKRFTKYSNLQQIEIDILLLISNSLEKNIKPKDLQEKVQSLGHNLSDINLVIHRLSGKNKIRPNRDKNETIINFSLPGPGDEQLISYHNKDVYKKSKVHKI